MSTVAHDDNEFVAPAEVPEMELYHAKTWLGKYVFSQDAKVIAIQYAITAMGVGLLALAMSLLIRLQLGFPGTFSFIDPAVYIQLVTMHGMIMVVYLLTALFLGGFGNYLIPLMVGARDMVFPYVNMLSFWIYFVAVLILLASMFVPGTRSIFTRLRSSAISFENGSGAGHGHLLVVYTNKVGKIRCIV